MMLPAMLVTLTTLLLEPIGATPVYNMQPAYITGNIGSGRNIRNLPCISKKTKQSGVCMFAIDCVKANGTHLGTCVDRFYFGSCCHIKPPEDIIDNSIETSIIPTRKPPINKLTTLPPLTTFGVPSISYTGASPTSARPFPSSTTIKNRFGISTTEKISSRITEMPISTTNSNRLTTTASKMPSRKPEPTKSPTKPTIATTTTTKKTPQTAATTPPHRNKITTTTQQQTYPTTSDFTELDTTTEQSFKLSTFQSVDSEPNTTLLLLTTVTTVAPTTVKAPTRPTKPQFSGKPTKPARITLKPVPLKPKPSSSATPSRNATTPRPTLRPRPTTVPVSTLMASTTPSTRKPQVTTPRPTVRVPTATSAPPRPTTPKKPIKVTRPSRPTATKPSRKPVQTTLKVPVTTVSASPTKTVPPKLASTTQKTAQTSTVAASTATRRTTTTPRPTAGLTTWSSTTSNDDMATTRAPPTTTLRDTVTDGVKPTFSTEEGTFIFSSVSTSSFNTQSTTSKPMRFPGEVATATATTQRHSTITSPPTTATPSVTLTQRIPSTTSPATKRTTPTPSATSESSTENGYAPVKLNVTGILEAVNGNPATNEIESGVKPTVQIRPDTTTTGPQLVTWGNVNDKTTTGKPLENTTEDDDWSPLTTPDGWVLLPSLTTNAVTGPSSTASSMENEVISPAFNGTTSKLPPLLTPLGNTRPPTTTPKVPIVAPMGTTSETNVSSVTLGLEVTPTTTAYPPIIGGAGSDTDMYGDVTNGSTSIRPPTGALNISDYRDVCGKRMFPQARIVGGERASYGNWPWQISLRQWRTSTYLHKCGAALLNENWAITAAHCVDNVPPSDLLLRLGEHDLSTEAEPYIHQERRVQIVASHPQFDPRTFEYDLALLRFYEPVQFQPNIIPVCVPENDENFVGKTAFVTGWGRLYEDGPLPGVLQEVRVPVINNTVCESMYRSAGYIEHIPNIFICAGWRKGGFDSCEGDSGGPMVIQRPDKRFLLAGVISWGIGCAEPNQPGVYTRISEFRDWINQILQF